MEKQIYQFESLKTKLEHIGGCVIMRWLLYVPDGVWIKQLGWRSSLSFFLAFLVFLQRPQHSSLATVVDPRDHLQYHLVTRCINVVHLKY